VLHLRTMYCLVLPRIDQDSEFHLFHGGLANVEV